MRIEHVNADNIFILPNNKNIILAANQAAMLCGGQKDHCYSDQDNSTGYYCHDQLYSRAIVLRKMQERMTGSDCNSKNRTGYLCSRVIL